MHNNVFATSTDTDSQPATAQYDFQNVAKKEELLFSFCLQYVSAPSLFSNNTVSLRTFT